MKRIIVFITLVLPHFVLSRPVFAQEAPPRPQGDSPTSCAQVILNPSTATGDFYVDDVLAAQAQNPAVLIPEVPHE